MSTSIAHRLAQIVAELLPPDADPQLAHTLKPVLDKLVAELLSAATVTVKDAIARQDKRIERHEAWTMERLDERSKTINKLREDQNKQQTQVAAIQDDVDALKARVVGDSDGAQ